MKQAITIKANGHNLKQENSVKYLSIYIDSNLNWKAQVENICKKYEEA